MGFKKMTQQDADAVGWTIFYSMVLLPLGWVFFRSSVGFAMLAIIQIGMVLFAGVFAFRFSRRQKCGRIVATLVSIAVYFLCCFLTNWLGALIITQRFHL
jgi:MFS family permease